MIAEPSRPTTAFGAAAAWPASGRSAWISGMKLTREPCSASTESAHAISEVLAIRRARTSPSEPTAPMN